MSLDMVLYPFVASLTLDASSGNVVGGATGSVFAKADTTFTTPLAAVDASGNPVTLTSNANGVLPSFFVDGYTAVNWKSGEWVFPLVTSEPVEGPEGPAGVSVNGATATGDDLVFSLSNGATTAPVKMPTAPGGSDAGVASYITTPGTATNDAVDATIEGKTTAVSAEIPKTYGAVVSPGAVELPVSHRHNAFPGLGRLSDGRWIAAWRGAWDHDFTNDGVLVVSFSTDGVKWDNPPMVVDTNVPTLGEVRDPSVTVTASGEVLLVFYARGVQRSYLIRSTDNGATWTAPAELPFPAGLAFACAPIIILPSGRWLVAAYNGDATAKTIVMRSDNQGATWASVTLTPVNPLAGFLEPNLLSLGGTNVLMLIRAQTGQQIYKTTSTDGGATWGTVTEAFFGTNNPHMIRWASGTISVFYRHPFHGGFMLRSSFDNGATWTRAFHVAQSKTFMGNATAVEMPETPGQALILWASEDNGPSSLATSTLSESGGVSQFGPIPHPAFEATRSRIPDTLWLPATTFGPVAGSTAVGNVSTHPGWLMDATSSEAVATTTNIPSEWEKFSVIVYGVSTTADLGTVVWDASYNQFGDTSNLTGGTFVNGPGIAFLEGVAGDVRPQTILSNLTPTERMVWQFRIIRDAVNASDTYPADVLFLGVELRRTK